MSPTLLLRLSLRRQDILWSMLKHNTLILHRDCWGSAARFEWLGERIAKDVLVSAVAIVMGLVRGQALYAII